jgi:hypothetical protein
MVVQSRPVSAEREDEYNDWYDNTHIPEILAIPGFVGVRRYKVPGPEPVYLAICDIEADDLSAPAKELRARSAAGRNTPSDAIQLDPPPVVTVYEELGGESGQAGGSAG